jgi:hypothetical protein
MDTDGSMARSEVCALTLEPSVADMYVVFVYREDGYIKKEFAADKELDVVIAALNDAGWQFAFRDGDGLDARLFFKRPLNGHSTLSYKS